METPNSTESGTINPAPIDSERAKQTQEAGISRAYAYHRPGANGLEKITSLRKAFSDLDALVKMSLPQCRERSEAITQLENAAMWAIKGVVLSDPESTVEN